MRLKDQRIVVTGGGSGLGKAIVDRFVTEGAHVLVVDRDQARLDALSGVSTYCGDVRSVNDGLS